MSNALVFHQRYPAPLQGAAEVWVYRLPPGQSDNSGVLSADECSRSERFLIPAVRERFIAAHVTAREIIGMSLGISPGDIQISHLDSGQPWLPDYPRISYSLSHSADLVAVALGNSTAVGVDIEAHRNIDVEGVSRRFLHPAESDFITASPHPGPELFYRCWTRKEAFLKFTGEGLARSLTSFRVSLDRPGQFCILDGSTERTDLTCQSFGQPGQWYGALVAGHPGQ